MDLTPKQQASEAIRQSGSILIVSGQRPNIDQVSSMVALSLILTKLGKKVTALSTDQLPGSASFITAGHIEKNLTGLREFIIKLDVTKSEVDKLKYDIEGGKLNVHIMPFKGGFTPSDVTYAHGDYHYDLIIVMGVPQRAKLDRVFEANPTLMTSTPVLNIDYHRINESYGAINLIDSNAATLSEMLISLAESLETGLIDEPIATAMLTGIIASTDRFTAAHTTAKSMTVAAQLMAAGAKQQNIVKALYGSRESGSRNQESGRDNGRDSRPPRQEQGRNHESGSRNQAIQQPVQQPVHSEPVVAPQPEPVVYAPTSPTPAIDPMEARFEPSASFSMPTNPTPETAMPFPAETVAPELVDRRPHPNVPDLNQA